jgi:hypothetical protein
MAVVHIGGELVKKIALVGDALGPEIPEMMMRSQIGISGSKVGSWVSASQSFPP